MLARWGRSPPPQYAASRIPLTARCLDFADAEDNRLEPREVVFASGLVHLIHCLLRTVTFGCLIATENTGCQLSSNGLSKMQSAPGSCW
jgi:hypothetical protein